MSIARVLKRKNGPVITVPPETMVVEAARILAERRIGILVVCTTGGLLFGVLSERDVVRAVSRDAAALADMPVSALATQSVITCTPQDEAQKVLETMQAKGFRHMPVVSYGKLEGLVSIGDLLKFLRDEAEAQGEAAVWSDLDYL